jgi:hypothetical protein
MNCNRASHRAALRHMPRFAALCRFLPMPRYAVLCRFLPMPCRAALCRPASPPLTACRAAATRHATSYQLPLYGATTSGCLPAGWWTRLEKSPRELVSAGGPAPHPSKHAKVAPLGGISAAVPPNPSQGNGGMAEYRRCGGPANVAVPPPLAVPIGGYHLYGATSMGLPLQKRLPQGKWLIFNDFYP